MAWPSASRDSACRSVIRGLTFDGGLPSMRVMFNHQPTELQAELTRRNLWQSGQVSVVNTSSFPVCSGDALGIALTGARAFDRIAVHTTASWRGRTEAILPIGLPSHLPGLRLEIERRSDSDSASRPIRARRQRTHLRFRLDAMHPDDPGICNWRLGAAEQA